MGGASSKIKQALLTSPDLHVVFQTDFLTVLENTSFVGETLVSDAVIVVDSLSDILAISKFSSPVVVLRNDAAPLESLMPLGALSDQSASIATTESGARIVSSTRTSPTSYELSVLAANPFLLVVSESYDPLWAAVVNGREEYPSIPVNGVINGYWIQETGSLEVKVEYKAQRAFTRGGVLSLAAATVLAVYWVTSKLLQLPKGNPR